MTATPSPHALTLDHVRNALTGPIASIRTPFNRDGSIDYAGVRHIIDFTHDHGGRVALLTAGDSHYRCMTEQEMHELTKVVVEHTAGRMMTIACDWEFATSAAVAFARYCRDLGVDILMIRPPDWDNSITTETTVAHFAAVAEILPVMIVTNLWALRQPMGLKTLVALREQAPGVLALKEDLCNDFARHACLIAAGRWGVFAGGGLRNHLNMHPYGCDGFMDRHMSFAPHISHRYWDALTTGRTAEAMTVIREIEVPGEKFMESFPVGRDAVVHGLMEVAGICGRWRRAPYPSLSDADLAKVKAWATEFGLLG